MTFSVTSTSPRRTRCGRRTEPGEMGVGMVREFTAFRRPDKFDTD
jgi:hypothetical protein